MPRDMTRRRKYVLYFTVLTTCSSKITFLSYYFCYYVCQLSKVPFVLAGPIVFIMTRRQRQMIKLYNVTQGNLDFVLTLPNLIQSISKKALMKRRDSQSCFNHFSPFKGHDNSEEDGGAEKYVLNFEQICCSCFMKWLKRDLENRGQICFCC